jgi:hypothetical protein
MANALTTALTNTRKILTKPGTSLLDVVRAIQVDAANELPTPVEHTLPKPVVITEEQRKALAGALDLIDSLSLPKTRRKLRAAERRDALERTIKLKDAKKVIDTAISQVKAAFFNHADIVAEEDGRAMPGVTPRDRNGWYLLDDKDRAGVVPGEPFKLTREFSNGSVEFTVDAVDELVQTGVIPAAARAKLIKKVEAVDEAALIAYLAEHPRDIPDIARKATQRSSPSVSFQTRQNK